MHRSNATSGDQARGAAFGLGAAALFGLSAPLAKVLLAGVPPVLLAGLLYLGAAAGLWLHRLWQPVTGEASLKLADASKLSGIVVAGGIVAPVLMLFGLARTTALAGSLLLNLEAPFTMLLAVVAFREHLGRYAAGAAAFILAGALVLKLQPGELGADTAGILLLAAACLCWALDNNLTQTLSLRDPFAIVRIKTLVAGVTNTALGLVFTTQASFPTATFISGALLLGALSYGVSVVLDAYALRFVGAVREAAYFATAPFMGAMASLVLLQEQLGWHDVVAMTAMAVGVALLLRERHGHAHTHEPLEHDHLHDHDDHHQHTHGPQDPAGAPHSHVHRHAPLAHDHPHVPDAHHRHKH